MKLDWMNIISVLISSSSGNYKYFSFSVNLRKDFFDTLESNASGFLVVYFIFNLIFHTKILAMVLH